MAILRFYTPSQELYETIRSLKHTSNKVQQMNRLKPSMAGVRLAHETIKPLINRTPLLQSEPISRAASSSDLRIRFFLKCENLQKAGSFKFRGASNFIAQQSDRNLGKGVVAISTGNFGHAVAHAARTAAQSRNVSISTSVVLPATAAPSKIVAAQQNGAKVVLAGIDPQDRELAAAQILKHTGATLIGPMDNPLIVNGQGTATLELVDQVQELGSKLDAVVLPSATGGLLAGAGIVCQDLEISVFGCEPSEGGPNLRHGVESGILPDPKRQFSIADGLRASTSKGNLNLIRQHVNGIYTATEPEIKHVWRMLIEEMKLMIEPSSAVSVATVMFNQRFRKNLAAQKRDWNIGIILTGGNTTVTRIIEEFGDSRESFKQANEPLQIAAT